MILLLFAGCGAGEMVTDDVPALLLWQKVTEDYIALGYDTDGDSEVDYVAYHHLMSEPNVRPLKYEFYPVQIDFFKWGDVNVKSIYYDSNGNEIYTKSR